VLIIIRWYVVYCSNECWSLFNNNVLNILCYIAKSGFGCDIGGGDGRDGNDGNSSGGNDRDGSGGNRDDDRMINPAAAVMAKTVMVAAVMTVAVTVMMGKAAADGNDRKGGGRQ
jgi:hypothetical protein